jgi:hypothetical protein
VATEFSVAGLLVACRAGRNLRPADMSDCVIVPLEPIQSCILVLRGARVMIDADLARLYGVATKRLNEQVKRNVRKFPVDFMFQRTRDEARVLGRLRSQNATLNRASTLNTFPTPLPNTAPSRPPTFSTVKLRLR